MNKQFYRQTKPLLQHQDDQFKEFVQEFRSILNVNFPRAFENPKDVAIRHQVVEKLKIPVNPVAEAFKKAGL